MKSPSAKLLLAAVFMARGTSFLFSKNLLQSLEPMSILAIRFMLAFAVLAIIFCKKLIPFDCKSLKGGLILGVLYTICMMFEMYGLRLVDSGVSALIENMAILFVPIYVAVLTKTLPKLKTIFCAILALIGVGFLSVTQLDKGNGFLGIVLVICAVLGQVVLGIILAVAVNVLLGLLFFALAAHALEPRGGSVVQELI